MKLPSNEQIDGCVAVFVPRPVARLLKWGLSRYAPGVFAWLEKLADQADADDAAAAAARAEPKR